MCASLVYLDRPQTKKETSSGQIQPTAAQIGYRYACSAMQGWRLNMVSFNNCLTLLSSFDITLF